MTKPALTAPVLTRSIAPSSCSETNCRQSSRENTVLFGTDDLPILTQNSEEGFVDCIFRVDRLKSDNDYYYFNLLASHDEERVGFAVKLVKHVGPGFDENMDLIHDHVYRPGVSFRSLGAISDRLVNVLAQLYGLNQAGLRMAPEETFTAIALQQTDTDLETCGVKFKLFGKDQGEFDQDRYYESFFNVDFPGGFVSWNEKDPDYRVTLIKGISTI